MKKILVIGSLNMDISVQLDRVPNAGETLKGNSLLTSPGGKGANQAYAIGKLGGDVAMLGAVGKDAYGDELCDSLTSVGVDVSRIRHVEGVCTGTAVIMVEARGENRIVILAGTNDCVDIPYIDENMDMIEQCDILLMQLEVPLETVVYAAKKAKELGKTVIVDPAPATADVPKALWAYVDYIKPNETELNMILTGRIDGLTVEEALPQVQSLGVKNVWVTLGGKGVFVRRENGEEELIPAIRVKAVDTTAAGDSFLAAATLSLARGLSDAEAVAYGNRVAAVAVTRPGAQQSVPTPEEVEAFFA
ncbi:MAG: ribokinase [Lachnospiraceae bacterium]|nr:ribokinase [Lachnospiraceae bacterium]